MTVLGFRSSSFFCPTKVLGVGKKKIPRMIFVDIGPQSTVVLPFPSWFFPIRIPIVSQKHAHWPQFLPATHLWVNFKALISQDLPENPAMFLGHFEGLKKKTCPEKIVWESFCCASWVPSEVDKKHQDHQPSEQSAILHPGSFLVESSRSPSEGKVFPGKKKSAPFFPEWGEWSTKKKLTHVTKRVL